MGRLVGVPTLVVIAHGPFVHRDEDDALLHSVPDDIQPRRVRVHTTLPVALERVHADPERLLANYPEFIEATYQRFEALLPMMPPSEWTFDTTTIDVEAIVEEICEGLPTDQ